MSRDGRARGAPRPECESTSPGEGRTRPGREAAGKGPSTRSPPSGVRHSGLCSKHQGAARPRERGQLTLLAAQEERAPMPQVRRGQGAGDGDRDNGERPDDQDI